MKIFQSLARTPTEELVAYFSGPIAVGADGYARTEFAMPSFNGTVKLMAIAWSKSSIGQASQDVLVRDPVERAYSHFEMERARGAEPEPDFETALRLEKSRILDAAPFLENNPESSNKAHQTYSYASRGFYVEQIERWFEYFPKQQFLFLKSEDFFANPKDALTTIYRFLEVEEMYPSNFKAENTGNYETLSPEIHAKLKPLFAEDQEKLKTLLGEHFTW